MCFYEFNLGVVRVFDVVELFVGFVYIECFFVVNCKWEFGCFVFFLEYVYFLYVKVEVNEILVFLILVFENFLVVCFFYGLDEFDLCWF